MCQINLISQISFDGIYKHDTFVLLLPSLFITYKLVICLQLFKKMCNVKAFLLEEMRNRLINKWHCSYSFLINREASPAYLV